MEEHRNKKGQLHRENGPAIIRACGTEEWFINGLRHRKDGPAITYSDGSKCWYNNGKLHREDGPANIFISGTQVWYNNGQLYRKDDLPHALNMLNKTMILSNGEKVSMSEDDYEKYKYKPPGRFTKAALREN